MAGEWIWWLSGALGLGGVVGAFFIVRHQLYLKQLKARGWVWDSHPQLADFLGYQLPPFGRGINRQVDDLVSGTTAQGHHFESFEYRLDGAGRFNERVLSLQLPAALPPAFIFAAAPRAGIGVGAPSLFEAVGAGLTVVAASADYASSVHSLVSGSIGTVPEGTAVDLSVDGDRLVLTCVRRDPDEMAAVLDALDPVASALPGLAATWGIPLPTPRYGFYGHPDWSYVGSDDSVLGVYPVATAGWGHETKNLIRGARDGIALDAFVHDWKTTETRVVSDGRGGTSVQTYTQDHSETVCGFCLPYALPTLSVNGSWTGQRVKFESEDFNDAFKVRAEDAKFASDVIHPRTMEWLLATRPSGWSMAGRVVVFEMGTFDTDAIDANEQTLRGFLGRIPRFVWADLGLPVPPFLVE
jgi:hypothetical protein